MQRYRLEASNKQDIPKVTLESSADNIKVIVGILLDEGLENIRIVRSIDVAYLNPIEHARANEKSSCP